ncbi:hypothetical protein [Agarilytica rhodophyticola]|uniref:hypothetical protein n=1 Tax=Agarilytica rhodophyticola TaxID=1737490 RepID=UPI000B343CBB|nr:hypothetical protein [Agarilytica rhodophyticola]
MNRICSLLVNYSASICITLSLIACGKNESSTTSNIVEDTKPKSSTTVTNTKNVSAEKNIDQATQNKIQQEKDAKFVKAVLSSSSSSQSRLYNVEAVIPSQCYTKTEGKNNPCLTCHQFTFANEGRANRMDDGDLQGDYGFSDVGVKNHWKNLFEDRTERIAAIPDDEILEYINQDNYSALAPSLVARGWNGWVPDLADLQLGAQAFDENGFAKDGSGWVAFNYMPLPSTFWPTNGSTDDVMIRLPEKFRTTAAGKYDRNIYVLNLTVVEAAIKNFRTLSIPTMNEVALGFDIDGDNKLENAVSEMRRPTRYFGAAADEKVSTFLYPVGTSFLHTVRYIGVNDKGDIYVPKRMKEVRYMVKTEFHEKSMLGNFYAEEQRDKMEGNLPRYPTLGDKGLNNKFGWHLIGFIENADGHLRQQVYEENLFCMGCHTTIGSTIDQTFAFARKVDGAAGWGYINLRGMQDVPVYGETMGGIASYLQKVGGGNEFRGNDELQEKYFPNGKLDLAAVNKAKDVYELIMPSRRRALDLNKAYRTIVQDQDFIFGRDANIKPLKNVFESIDTEIEPLEKKFRSSFDMRLDWSKTES